MRRFAALALLAAAPAFAADPSLAQVPPGQGGHARLLLDPGVSGPLTAQDVVVLVGNGGARATGLTPFGNDPVYTAIAFDASGSFRAHLAESIAAAQVFAGALPPTSRTAVFTFGAQLSDLGEDPSAAVGPLIAEAQDAPIEKVTRLKGLVGEVVDRAAQRQPGPGLRQVIVFTDAGEESSVYRLDDLVANARQRGVQVHVVAFGGAGGRQVATRLDEMKALAERTGGAHLDGSALDLFNALTDVARAPDRLAWVDVDYCAVAAPTPFVRDTLQVEIRRGPAPHPSTGKVEFNQEVGGTAPEPCRAAPPVGDPTVATQPPATAAPPGGLPGWAFALAGLGLLGLLALLGLGALATRAKTGTPPPRALGPAPAAPSHSPGPTEDAVVLPAPPDPTDPFGALPPETQLTVTRADGGPLEPYYRLTTRETVFGASKDADVVINLPRISSRHAKFELFPNGAVWVTDLDSLNGTVVDGRRLAPHERVRLPPGAVVGLSQQLDVRLRQPSLEPVSSVGRSAEPAQAVAGPPAGDAAPGTPAPAGAPDAKAAPERKVAKTIFEGAGAVPVSPPAPGASGAPRKPARTLYSPADED